MKTQLKTIIAITLLSISILSFAENTTTCDQDVDEMKAEIARWGSITLPDGSRQFDKITSPVIEGDKGCSAEGSRANRWFCILHWDKGSWGSTLFCGD